MHVEEGHHQVGGVRGGEGVGGRDVGQGCGEVGVGERHALGPAGGAGGVEEEGDVRG